MYIKVLSTSNVQVLTESEVRSYLKIDNDDESDIINLIINSSIDFTEQFLRRTIKQKTLLVSLDSFPVNEIKLPYSPVVSISSVKYYDDNNTLNTINSSEYIFVQNKLPCEIVLRSPYTWPVPGDRSSAVEIEYIAGLSDIKLLHPTIKQGLLLLCSHFYNNRDIVLQNISVQNVPLSYNYLLSPYRVLQFTNKSVKTYG